MNKGKLLKHMVDEHDTIIRKFMDDDEWSYATQVMESLKIINSVHRDFTSPLKSKRGSNNE